MKRVLLILLGLLFALSLSACSGGGDNEEDSGIHEDADGGIDAGADNGSDPGADETADKGGPGDQGIGSACSCDGQECEQTGVPKPADGTILGCDDIPIDWTGGARVCMRTYEGALATNTYFANGYCGLMATKCTGADLICNSAVFGDYDNMTACPQGSVMLVASQDVDVFGYQATIDNKTCVAACESNADCRTGEHDPVVDDATQYQCIDKDGVKFCYDPRNLPDTYTATAY
ncbi:MAG TPA: hypothetical protein VM425_17255 [Myxococcota bacterium]|nr:hypothetical protein [Myxococcota bacterium]